MKNKHRSKSEFQEENEQVVIMKSRKVQLKRKKRAGYKKLRDKIMTDVLSGSNLMTMSSYEGKYVCMYVCMYVCN